MGLKCTYLRMHTSTSVSHIHIVNFAKKGQGCVLGYIVGINDAHGALSFNHRRVVVLHLLVAKLVCLEKKG